MLLFGGVATFYDVILAPLFQMVEHHVLIEDLELLESDPSTFIKNMEPRFTRSHSSKWRR